MNYSITLDFMRTKSPAGRQGRRNTQQERGHKQNVQNSKRRLRVQEKGKQI